MAGLQIQNPSITSGAFASMLAFSSDNNTITAISGHPIAGVGGGGTPVEGYWRPSVNTAGDISWAWSLESTSTVPSTANIKGPQGEQGIQGETGPQGPSGTNGTDGQDGTNGYSPAVSTTTITDGERTGTEITFTFGEGGLQTTSYSAWNGVDGEGATVNLLEGSGIQITHAAGTTNYTIGVSADYVLKSELPDVTDMATKTWVGQQNFATSAGLDDDKQFAMTTAGWKEVAVPSVPDITATNGISANGHNIGLTTDVYSAIQEISAANDLVGANGISVVAGANNQVIIAPSGISPSKQYAMTTSGWEEVQAGTTETAYVPLSGGTVSGQLVVSGGSTFDQQFLKIIREGVNGYARLGLGQSGPLALKVDDSNGHTTQVNISPNATNDQLVQVQHGGTTSYLIPAQIHQGSYTPTTADGILHIVLESE